MYFIQRKLVYFLGYSINSCFRDDSIYIERTKGKGTTGKLAVIGILKKKANS